MTTSARLGIGELGNLVLGTSESGSSNSFAQAQADIVQVYKVYAQAQADIKQTLIRVGQAQAYIYISQIAVPVSDFSNSGWIRVVL